MTGRSLTAANIVYMLAIDGLYDVPQQLQGFAPDMVFDTDALTPAEVQPGVDGRLSGGWIYVPTVQNIMLQADSLSCDLFDKWYSAQQAFRETYIANAIIVATSLQREWTLTRGFLTNYTPIPSFTKLAQPRRFTITWEFITVTDV